MSGTHHSVATEERAVVEPSPQPVASGASDVIPFALAVVPFGLTLGAAAAEAGFSTLEATFGAVTLLAGAAQLATIESIQSGSPMLATLMITVLINLRFVLYGAGASRWFTELPLRQRLLLTFPVVDQTFALCGERFAAVDDVTWRRSYYVTATSVLAGTFLASQALAFHVGGGLPASLGLHLAAPMMFAAMAIKAITDRRTAQASVTAGVLVLIAATVTGSAAIPLAVVGGVASAAFISRSRS